MGFKWLYINGYFYEIIHDYTFHFCGIISPYDWYFGPIRLGFFFGIPPFEDCENPQNIILVRFGGYFLSYYIIINQPGLQTLLICLIDPLKKNMGDYITW